MALREPLSIARPLAEFLEKNRIEYVFIGAFAVSVWGEPRSTGDLDLIILLTPERVDELVEFLKKEDFDLDRTDVREALAEKSHFTAFDRKSVFRLDIKGAYTDADFATLARRKRIEVDSDVFYVSSPEDTIANKLSFGSERDFLDAESILIRQKTLDRAYLQEACKKLGVENKLSALEKRLHARLKKK
jgi:hypothetical protein